MKSERSDNVHTYSGEYTDDYTVEREENKR